MRKLEQVDLVKLMKGEAIELAPAKKGTRIVIDKMSRGFDAFELALRRLGFTS